VETVQIMFRRSSQVRLRQSILSLDFERDDFALKLVILLIQGRGQICFAFFDLVRPASTTRRGPNLSE